MRIRKRRRAGARPETEQDFELNLASIIDCFTVLITYLLISASFISIGVLDVSAVTTEGSATDEPPPLIVSIKMTKSRAYSVDLSGAKEGSFRIPASADGGWDVESLKKQLGELKRSWPKQDSAAISAADPTVYRDVVRTVEAVREIFPGVALGDSIEDRRP